MKPVVERLLYIALATTVFGVMLLLILLVSVGQKLDQQLKYDQQQQQSRAAHTQQIIDQINAKSDTQTAYIRCIANFFAQPNRATMTLANLDNCQINKAGAVNSSATFSGEPSPIAPYRTLPDINSSQSSLSPSPKISTPSPKPPDNGQPNGSSILSILLNALTHL